MEVSEGKAESQSYPVSVEEGAAIQGGAYWKTRIKYHIVRTMMGNVVQQQIIYGPR